MVASSVYFLHQDALGSTRLVATASGVLKFSSNYVPYGQNYQVSGKEVFMYTGKPYDSATGLYYYGARYYDDNIGRFVTEDSYTGDKNDPMSLNLYLYARDNPEKYSDPSGHMIGHMYYTDYDESKYLNTLPPVCVGGVCQFTTTETYDGYTSKVTTYFGIQDQTTATITPLTATTADLTTTTTITTAMTAAFTDIYASGLTQTSSYSKTALTTATTTVVPILPQVGSPLPAEQSARISNALGIGRSLSGGDNPVKTAIDEFFQHFIFHGPEYPPGEDPPIEGGGPPIDGPGFPDFPPYFGP